MFVDAQKLFNDTLGVTFDSAKTGQFADFETIARPKTPQEITIAQARVDDLYDKFITKVSDSRKIPKDTVQGIAQGRVWTGQDAKPIKLVDEFGGLQDAINYAAKQANLGTGNGDYRLKEYPQQLSFSEALAILLSHQSAPVSKATDPLTKQFLQLRDQFKTLQQLNDPLGAYARMPLGWDIR
jgi:protease-4